MGFARSFRRQMKRNQKVSRKRRKLFIEPLEPRLLLSADNIVGGIAASLTNGLTAVGTEFGDLIKDDPIFDKYVPGIVETLELGDNVYQVSPTLEEAMDISVDVYAPSDPAGTTGTIQERFQDIGNLTFIFYGDLYKDEIALRTMDLDGDDKVTVDEAFKVMVAGQLQSYLDTATIVDMNSSGGLPDAIDVALQVEAFLDGPSTFGIPAFLNDRLDLTVNSVSSSYKNDTLTWTMDFALSLIENNTFDLGYEAENLGIALDPGTPPNPNSSPYSLPVSRTIDFDSLSFGVRNVSGGVVNNDFFFAAPDLASDPDDGVRIGVNVGTTVTPYNTGLVGVDVNVGFLGAEIISSISPTDDGVVLDMNATGGAVDPSNPSALGFAESQLGTLNTGAIEADNTVDLAKLVDTPIEFTLKLGTDAQGVEHIVTLPQGSYADAAAVVASLNTALTTAGFSGIVTASDGDTDSKIEFTVVATDPTPLGFSLETESQITISGDPSTLVGKTAAQLSASPDANFLLVVTDDTTGVSVARLVSVNITTFSGPGGDGSTGSDDDETYLTDVEWDLQTAVNTAFSGTGITIAVGTDGSELTLESTDHRVEITRRFTIETLEQITLSEIQGTSQVFEVAPDSSAAFDVNLTLKALDGLKDELDAPYKPVGTIKVHIDPFSGTDVKKIVIDKDPPTNTEIVSTSYQLTDSATVPVPLIGGLSDLQPMLDFNVIAVSDILGIFTQIGNWFDRVTASDLLLGFDIPFADTTLGSLLNLKDLITDTFLIDDRDDGPTKSGPVSEVDIPKLLEWIGDAGEEQLRALFGNAQQLETRLNFLLPLEIDATVFRDTPNDPQNLTYDLSIAGVTLDVDPQTAGEQPLTVPLDFEIDLGSVANFETSGQLAVTATGDIGFTLGIILGNAVDVLDNSTPVPSLNSDNGVTLNTNLALTSLGVIDPLVGRLSADAVFVVTTFDGTTATPYTVTLTKAATDNNLSLNDTGASDSTTRLLDDLNAALAAAGLGSIIVAETDPMQGDTMNAHIVLRATNSDIERFQVETATNNTAYTELGLQTQSASTVYLVAPVPVPDASPIGDVSLTFAIERTGGPTSETITLTTAATGNNVALQSLIEDLNAVLPTGIVASQSGGHLVLSAIDSDITAFTVNDASELGLILLEANKELIDFGVTTLPPDLVAGVQLQGGAPPKDPFGRLDVDVTFTINGQNISISKVTAADNTSIDDLIRDLNTAIEGTSLKGMVAAINDNYRIALRAIDKSVDNITVAGLDAGEGAALGMAGDSSAAGLTLRSTKNAPVSYGVSETTPFTVKINGTDYSATLIRDNTITNRSLYDLAGSLNSAINSALGGAGKNPLIVTVQGGQIVIGLKTGIGSNLIGDPSITTASGGVAPSEVISFSVFSGNPSFINELKLASATGETNANLADTTDFIIFFRDGTIKEIYLDDLDTDTDQKIDSTLGELIFLIETQAGAANLEIGFGSDGTSLKLTDKTSGTNEFKVVAVNGSPAAVQLGIMGSDTANINVNELPADAAGTADGVIDGGRIATIDLVDRVYLENVSASAGLTISTLGVASAEASFGFAGIKVESGDGQTLFTASANLPLFDSLETLGELFDALIDETGSSLATLIGDPTLTLSSDFDLNVSILPGFDVTGFTPPTIPTVTFMTDTVEIDLADINAVLPEGQLFPDLGINIQTNNFGDLLNFESIKFDNVLDAVEAIAGFLNQFEALGFLGDEIPVLGLSVNDLLDIADQFQQAVDDFRDNPAGGIQKLAQKIREAFGLPEFASNTEAENFLENFGIEPGTLTTGYQLIQFSLVGTAKDILKLDLRLPVAFSKGLNVDLDLGDALGTGDFIDIQGGAGMAASGYLDAQLSFGIDLNNPTNLLIYDDTTGVFGGLNAGASNLQFNAAIGPLGAFIKDALVDVAIAFDVTGDDSDGSPESLTDFLGQLEATLTGDAEATLPVFFPTDSEYLGDISFTANLDLDLNGDLQFTPNLVLPNFSEIDLLSIDPFGSIPLMLDSLDFFLQGLQDILDGEVFGIELPLIGDQLQGGVDFIESLRNDVMTPIRKYAEQAPELGKEIVQKLLFSLLGPGSDGVTIDGQSLSGFLGLTGEFPGLNMLKDFSNNSIIDLNDLPFEDDGTGALWEFQLGGTAPISIDLAFDLGIPALALESDAALDISLTWGLALGLGINTTDGAYILIGDHGGTFGDEELQLSLDIDVRDGSSITGSLGFLQLEIAESLYEDPLVNDLEHESRGTYLHGEFSVDLVNSANLSDTKLSFSELGSIDAIINLEADAEVNLEITGRFNPDLLPETISALLPEISGRFVLDWETGNIVSDNFDFADSLKFIGFRDVQADMGSFINDLIKPFVEKISEVTDPLQPIIDVVTAPIPVISDLAGQPITLVDIAGMTGYVEPALIYAVADIISLVNEIGSSDFGAFGLPLGDFVLLDSESTDTDYLSGSQLLTAGYTLASDTTFDGENLAGFLGATLGALEDFDILLGDGSGDTDTQGFVSGLQSGSEGGSGFDFPVFDDPSLLFGLLLGKDIPLVTYDLAPFKMEFTYVQKFPIWDALFVRIGGSVGLSIDLAFGYDTAGVREFAEGGFSNPLDLLAGLYVSDTNQPTGEGVDVPELILKGELFAGAELNLGIASAGAEGVIGLVTNFDLYDPDSDGRVRIDELLGNFLYEWNYGTPALAPIAIFDVYGEVYAQLRAFVEAMFFKIEFEITPKITLIEFEIQFERQPFLATERGDGSLLLNIGPNAAQRLNDDTRDIAETIKVKSISDSEVLVWGMGINESDAQKYQVDKDKGIFGYGGADNDIIDLSGVTHGIVYTVEGGTGDDTIKGTAGGGELKGDLGNDTLTGGAGVDLIIGGTGNDTIDGKGSADIIFGDNGTVSAITGGSRYRSFVGEKDGDDKIKGDEGNDIIFGGGGFDWIEGGAGNDIVLGDGGNFDTSGAILVRNAAGRYDVNARGTGTKDTIFGNAGLDALFGGAGNDLIDGGADIDEIDAGDGFDVVYGGSGADTIFGGNNDDIIFGFRDPQGATFDQAGDTPDTDPDGIDKIYGEEGNDFIRGQDADDELYGGRGADIMFGDADNDKMFGEAGGDIMFGGADNDEIDGAAGADIVFGDDGLVAYVDFDPGKIDFNFTGSRIRFLGGDQLIGDSDESLIAGYSADSIPTSRDLIVTIPLASDGSDTVIGGDGKDIIFGGGGLLDTLFGDFDPVAGFTGPRPNGQDIMIGDGGRVELYGRRNARAAAESNSLDGIDHVTGNDGGDYIFGGGEEDIIYGFQQATGTVPLEGVFDNDVILGDNGEILFDTSDSKNRIEQVRTTVVTGDSGMSDVIDGDFDNDIVFGGLNSSSDVITGDVGDDILLGDNGEVIFDEDGDLDTLDRVESYRDALGGNDIISGNDGNDILIGGTADDLMSGDNGEDILLGDNARIELAGPAGRLLVQVAAMPAPTAIDLITTTDAVDLSHPTAASAEAAGGADTMSGNAGNDILFGGVNNGGIDTMYGDAAVVNNAADGNDILAGDNGLLDFTYGSDTERMTLDLIRTTRDGLGGTDIISGNKGSDIAIGGTGDDTIYGDNALAQGGDTDLGDILLGDNADIFTKGAFDGPALLKALGTGVSLITTTDTEESTGGVDTISGNVAADVIVGGVAGDILYGDASSPANSLDGDDVLLGDNGELDFADDLEIDLTPAGSFDLNTLDRIESFTDGLGAVDMISGNAGADTAMGGTDGDTIFGDNAAASGESFDKNDMLLGDNGIVLLVDPAKDTTVLSTTDRILILGGAVASVRSTDEPDSGPNQAVSSDTGGMDTISGNAGGDIILGGVLGDTLYGDRSNVTVETNDLDGRDIQLGDNGQLEWLSQGRLGEITGVEVSAQNSDLSGGFSTRDIDLDTLDLITTEQPTNGGRDTIYGDNARDVIFGGTDADTLYGDTGSETDGRQSANGNDLMFGDHGRLYPQFSRYLVDSTLLSSNDIYARNFFAIDIGDTTSDPQTTFSGEGDRMWGEEGDDIMLGQQGDDRMWGGSDDDDMTGGHNVSGGFDELSAPAIDASLAATGIPDPAIDDVNDLMDGGSGDDAMAGDNAIIWRRGDDLSPRFRELTEVAIYTTDVDTIKANIGANWESDPADAIGRDIELVDHSDGVQADPQGRFGADVMAGGADSDVMFGELASDLMQGDGAIESAQVVDPLFITHPIGVTDGGIQDTGETLYFNIPEALTDADDYMEGNGGSDLMYGGLGQDDMIGGSSALFGLINEDMRPDSSDYIFGGAGVAIGRNDIGATTFDLASEDPVTHLITTDPDGYARDADFIMGDNANVYRLVDDQDAFLNFNYDDIYGLQIIPRAMEQLDYTLGGADYEGGSYINGAADLDGSIGPLPADNGAADLIHGESGDDIIFGMTGSDLIFGEGQDDSIVGGYGHDWISGGTGQDGVLGDDGLIYTSRNSLIGEPLYGIDGLLDRDPRPKYADGNVLDEVIKTPGEIQFAVINRSGELKKTVDLVPFSFDPDWNAMDDEFPDNQDAFPYADDIIFGGLGSDWLHGGSGDDAISGAEALENAYVPTYDENTGEPDGVLDLGYDAVALPSPVNPGNVLAFNSVDVDGRHLNNRFRAGEFALYDEYDPLRKIQLNDQGELWKPEDGGTPKEFLLNFDETEGVVRPEGDTNPTKPSQNIHYDAVNDDGKDAIFGDLGNDWLVGGTGRDDMYGGWGNDFINADDDQTTLGDAPKKGDPEVVGANDLPDTHPYYEDRAYGGAGRDILIANTGGDRLIDWVGEYNSYLVPYAPFGMATVSRTLQPFLPEFLYALSAGDGADPTRSDDTGANPLRNGEPDAEMGLVLQKDFAWQDQTGPPADPQAGNIPGGKRDVLRSADFNDGSTGAMFADSGLWRVENGVLKVSAESLGADAVSVFNVNEYLPNYFEILAAIATDKPTGGVKANAYIIFDYYSPIDFKFAGLNASSNKMEMGHRDETGWHVDVQTSTQIKSNTFYNLLVAVNGTTVTMRLDGTELFNYTFEPRVIDGWVYGLNSGMVGFGSYNSKGLFDNIVVQKLPPVTTFETTEDFSDAAVDLIFVPTAGQWQIVGDRYEGMAFDNEKAVSLVDLGLTNGMKIASILEFEATLNTQTTGGVVFDYYGPDDFKFASISAENNQVVVGHFTSGGGWSYDSVFDTDIEAGTDYELALSLKGTTVSVSVKAAGAQDFQAMVSHVFNAVVVDGGFGLLTKDGSSSFDAVTVKTDDSGAGLPSMPFVSISDAAVNEGDSGLVSANVTFTLSEMLDEAVTVEYYTADGSAIAGDDFQAATGTVIFNQGETSVQVPFYVVGDLLPEIDETFSVHLSNPLGAQIIDDTGVVTILNDEVLPVVSVSASDNNASEAGPDTGTFEISRDLADNDLIVALGWSGAAAINEDFSITSDGGAWDSVASTLTLSDGVDSAILTITPVDDTVVEGIEDIILTLLPGSDYEVGDPSNALVNIADNDIALPSISISDATLSEGDSGSVSATLTFTLSEASLNSVSVAYATADGTAFAAEDYQAATGTVTFDPGQTSVQVPFNVLGDQLDEADETFSVQLSNPVGAQIDDGTGVVTILNDDAATFPSLSISDAEVVEGDKSSRKVNLTITLSEPLTEAVTVTVSTQNGTAWWGEDYREKVGTVYFDPGETSQQFFVRVYGDKVIEDNETFTVVLSDPTGAVIDDGVGVVTIIDDDAKLLAATTSTEPEGSNAILTEDQLVPIVDEAILRLTEAYALDQSETALLESVAFEIGDLNGLVLGETTGTTVLIDDDAAGFGWFIDLTPYDDSEFNRHGSTSELEAKPSSEAYGDMDLLTVVMHELGHVLGIDHTAQEGLMDATLDTGARYLADGADITPLALDEKVIDSDHRKGDNSVSLVRMDVAEQPEGFKTSNGSENRSWVSSWLLNGSEDDAVDPNSHIQLVITNNKNK